MKLKLSNSEMLCLVQVLMSGIDEYRWHVKQHPNHPDVMDWRMLIALLEELMIELKRRSLIRQAGYRVTMKPATAFAFHSAFNGKLKETDFIGNLVQTICNNIHQQYA